MPASFFPSKRRRKSPVRNSRAIHMQTSMKTRIANRRRLVTGHLGHLVVQQPDLNSRRLAPAFDTWSGVDGASIEIH